MVGGRGGRLGVRVRSQRGGTCRDSLGQVRSSLLRLCYFRPGRATSNVQRENQTQRTNPPRDQTPLAYRRGPQPQTQTNPKKKTLFALIAKQSYDRTSLSLLGGGPAPATRRGGWGRRVERSNTTGLILARSLDILFLFLLSFVLVVVIESVRRRGRGGWEGEGEAGGLEVVGIKSESESFHVYRLGLVADA